MLNGLENVIRYVYAPNGFAGSLYVNPGRVRTGRSLICIREAVATL